MAENEQTAQEEILRSYRAWVGKLSLYVVSFCGAAILGYLGHIGVEQRAGAKDGRALESRIKALEIVVGMHETERASGRRWTYEEHDRFSRDLNEQLRAIWAEIRQCCYSNK